ncbi:MAG TPA: DNA polymerase Y family protein [Actinomycetaceae bacterium]|nr:DNA polymerase Y family protein [Actinomycetaceae bacterium]
MTARRVAVWVPDWPVAAAVIQGLAAAHEPVAVHDGREVLVCSAAARRQGVRRGMRRRSAQGVCPELVLVAADEDRDARNFEAVAQGVEEVAAGVQVLRPGVVLLPARGAVRHAGSEERLAELIVGEVAEHSGAECQVGISEGLLAPLLAAQLQQAVPVGEAAAFLAPHRIETLELGVGVGQRRQELSELAGVLHRLGLRTLGAFAALPAGDVAARFGARGLWAHALAGGGELRVGHPRRPEPDITVQADLDPPIARVDVAAFAARGLAEKLADRLLRRGLLCARLRIEAGTENGERLTRTWRLDASPTAAELTDRVRWQLEGWLTGRSARPPSAPLLRLELTAEEVGPAGAHSEGLWGRAPKGGVQAQRAALRVQSLLGVEQVLIPVLQGGRHPRQRTRLVAWGDEPVALRSPEAPWPGRLLAPEPATVFAEPPAAELLDAQGRPVTCSERGAVSASPAAIRIPAATDPRAPRELVAVRAWSGPWLMAEEWWRVQGAIAEQSYRTFLQVLPAEGPAVLLAQVAGAWRVEAAYD